jgi:HPt (histidine-containing phosphotransfer) domain-containing protein
MPRAFDGTELLDRVDNDWEFLGETVRMLEADGPALLEELRRCADAGDAPSVGKAAHALKGMISNFCAPDAQAGALAVEQMGKSGDLAPLPPALQLLETRVRSLIADLNEFLATKA